MASVWKAANMYLNLSCMKIAAKARQKQTDPIWILKRSYIRSHKPKWNFLSVLRPWKNQRKFLRGRSNETAATDPCKVVLNPCKENCSLWDFIVQMLYCYFSLAELLITFWKFTSKPRTAQYFFNTVCPTDGSIPIITLVGCCKHPAGQEPFLSICDVQVVQMETESQSHKLSQLTQQWPATFRDLHFLLSQFYRKVDFYGWFCSFLIECYRSHFVHCSFLAQGKV